jgi:pantoate--beta-alanine ligase
LKQIKTIDALKEYLHTNPGMNIGFVPTMGALHEGHLSLLNRSISECDITVCSIFINPTQFNNPADYEKYPITIDKDLSLLEQAGCDVVFLPSIEEMYPHGTKELKQYDLGILECIMEGKFRPGHFQGVCNIVDRLLDAVRPNKLFMGEKDYQQIAVIKRMLSITNMEIEMVTCPTIRSSEGLALSSRNMKLTDKQKKQALAIFNGFQLNSPDEIRQNLLDNGFDHVDYVCCADPETLEEKPFGDKPYIILVAAFLGGVRLIDNKIFK